MEGTHDAVGNRIARGDATKNVDEHGLDLLVAQDDVKAVGHDLSRRTAADVEEVGRLRMIAWPSELLTGVGHTVKGRHDKPRSVANDAYGAVELDVVEVLGLGRCLERVGGSLVLERRVVGVPESRVLVEGDLSVE